MEDEEACPVNFNIVPDEPINTKFGYCRFCHGCRSKFCCTKCVQAGNFIHSTSFIKESLVEKQIRLANLRKALTLLDEKADIVFTKRKQYEDLACSIETRKKNIENLRLLIKEKRESIAADKEINEKLTKENANKSYFMPRYGEKVKRLEDYVLSKIDEVTAARRKHTEQFAELQMVVRNNIEAICKYIFPIKHIAGPQDLRQDTENVISEATHTVCVKGSWQLQDSGCTSCYIIVAPHLSSDGDYNIYNDWVLTNKDAIPTSSSNNLQSETTTIGNSAYRISAALTYTAQLVQLLSFYLDTRLPYKLNFCDFCKVNMSEKMFNYKVQRLNANILHLCYTQKMKLPQLHPSHTLENLYKLLYTNASNLGYRGFVEVVNCMQDHENHQFAKQLHQNQTHSSFDSDTEDSDEAALTHEWESVPHNVFEGATGHNLHAIPQQAPTMPASFVTSFTSMFRWK
ncbi:beclin 1-associated autophagy-related key regulator [Culicoides brevitarsis]|uniref:beclin 1-associated autophagy-related key regulator n=1 Tax=Culicoides brevitarsis TaxID=469753 RepID=UPI00307C58C7